MNGANERLIRSGATSVAATALDFTATTILVEAGNVRCAPAALLASALGAVLCFTLNRWWAFRDQSPLHIRQLRDFVLVGSSTAFAVACAVHAFTTALHLPYLAAKALAAVIVFAIWTYPMQSRIFCQGARYEPTPRSIPHHPRV